jgi:hypothetical protein
MRKPRSMGSGGVPLGDRRRHPTRSGNAAWRDSRREVWSRGGAATRCGGEARTGGGLECRQTIEASRKRDEARRCRPREEASDEVPRAEGRPEGGGGAAMRGRGRTADWRLADASDAGPEREAATPSRKGSRRGWESDSSIVYDGGAIFGQPQERKPGFAAGSQGPKRVGKVGVKVRRVAHVGTKVTSCGPVEGPRGPERGDALQGRGGQQ